MSTAQAPTRDDADRSPALKQLRRRIRDLTRLMAAAGTHSLLVILQGIDTAGKDAVIKKVFGAVDPQLLRVTYFRKPTERETAHDFLWRAHRAAPRRGRVALWHRSHYEDLLAPLVDGSECLDALLARKRAIDAFEELLRQHADTIIVRCWLDVSAEEQRRRLAARHKNKRWKLSASDARLVAQYPQLLRAYETLFAHDAETYGDPESLFLPVHHIGADDKLARDIAVASHVVETLSVYEEQWQAALYPTTEQGSETTWFTSSGSFDAAMGVIRQRDAALGEVIARYATQRK